MDTDRAPRPSHAEHHLGPLGTFASPAMEAAFRRRHLPDDRWLYCFLVAAGALRVAALLLADYFHFGVVPAFWMLLAGRIVFLVLSAWVMLALQRADRPAVADRLFLGWCLVLGALTMYAISTRPPGNTDRLLINFAAVLVIYCVTPLPLPTQAALAAAYSVAVLFLCRGADGVTLSTVVLVHGMSNVFGLLTSWRLNHRRREAYLGTLREAELRAGLEAALAEVRTLRGLMRVCAWCKRVRDEEEAWQTLETYVQSRTNAEITHGICPGCLQAQVGEMQRARC